VIHISTAGENVVKDLTLTGIEGTPTSAPEAWHRALFKDDLTSTTVPSGTLALYALGETVPGFGGHGGTSRFTTYPGTATWFVGTGAPTSSCAVGSLLSNTAATTANTTLYVCTSGGWTALNVP
jgi:hypothetical protein